MVIPWTIPARKTHELSSVGRLGKTSRPEGTLGQQGHCPAGKTGQPTVVLSSTTVQDAQLINASSAEFLETADGDDGLVNGLETCGKRNC